MSNIRESMLGCVDKILGIKDQIGAIIEEVHLVTRTWTGERVGDGDHTDVETQIIPTPCIKDFSHDVRTHEAGVVKSGDLILTGISRNKYTDELTLRTDTTDRSIEKLYHIGKHYYRLVHIKENLLTWDIHIRKVHFDENERR